MDLILDLRLADNFAPGFDLAGDEDLVEGFFGDTFGNQIRGYRVVCANQREDRIFGN